MRRVVPVQGLQLFMVHHSTNKAQVRRSKEDLLTMVGAGCISILLHNSSHIVCIMYVCVCVCFALFVPLRATGIGW